MNMTDPVTQEIINDTITAFTPYLVPANLPYGLTTNEALLIVTLVVSFVGHLVTFLLNRRWNCGGASISTGSEPAQPAVVVSPSDAPEPAPSAPVAKPVPNVK